MLDYQLDTLAIKWMHETMKTMLKELWEVLKCHSAESWFDVFLVIFILLNNLEYVYETQLEYAQQHGFVHADHDHDNVSGLLFVSPLSTPLRNLPGTCRLRAGIG